MPVSEDIDLAAMYAQQQAQQQLAFQTPFAFSSNTDKQQAWQENSAQYNKVNGMYAPQGGQTNYNPQQIMDMYNNYDPALFRDPIAVRNLLGMQNYWQGDSRGAFAPGTELTAGQTGQDAYSQSLSQWKVDQASKDKNFNITRNAVGLGAALGGGSVVAGGMLAGAGAGVGAGTGVEVGAVTGGLPGAATGVELGTLGGTGTTFTGAASKSAFEAALAGTGGGGGWLSTLAGLAKPILSVGSGLYGLKLANDAKGNPGTVPYGAPPSSYTTPGTTTPGATTPGSPPGINTPNAQQIISQSAPWTAMGGQDAAGKELMRVISGDISGDPGYKLAETSAARASAQQPGGFAASAAANAAFKYQNDRIQALSSPAGVGFNPASGVSTAVTGANQAEQLALTGQQNQAQNALTGQQLWQNANLGYGQNVNQGQQISNQLTSQSLASIGYGATGNSGGVPSWLTDWMRKQGIGV